MSSLGKNFRITIFGASHGEAIGVVMEGLPVGFAIDMDALNAFLTRRAPGGGGVRDTGAMRRFSTAFARAPPARP